jgi:hypothetical protein
VTDEERGKDGQGNGMHAPAMVAAVGYLTLPQAGAWSRQASTK